MTVPELVRERLADEDVRARVSLGGEDELIVTASRTIVYRAEGLLSGESVEEHSHEVERIDVSGGRRKSTIRLDHGIEGETEFTVPTKRLDDALAPVFAGVLRAAGVMGPEEEMERVYRSGDLTIAITDARVVKHVGGAIWDEEYEEYAFEDVTRLDVEEGDVSSQIIVEVAGRPQRIKTPSEDAREVREHVERALLAHHGVGSYREFLELVAPEEDEPEAGEADDEPEESAEAVEEGAAGDEEESGLLFEETDPLGVEETRTEGAEDGSDVAEEVAALREAVERQNELLADQQRTIAKLIEELRRGR